MRAITSRIALSQRRAAPAGQIAWLTERASCSKPMKRVPASPLRDRRPIATSPCDTSAATLSQ